MDPALQQTTGEKCGLGLFSLALNADARPGNGLEADFRYRLFAIHADSKDPGVDPVQGFVYGAKQLRVCLLERQVDVEVVLLARVIHPITDTHVLVHGRGSVGAREDLFLFAQEDGLKLL